MRGENEIVRELDAAQADLERQVAAVKDLVDDVLAKPRRVMEVVRRPMEILTLHPIAAFASALLLGVLVGAIRRRRIALY